jgi:hypothetical protein
MRRVGYREPEKGQTLVFLTNNFTVPALSISIIRASSPDLSASFFLGRPDLPRNFIARSFIPISTFSARHNHIIQLSGSDFLKRRQICLTKKRINHHETNGNQTRGACGPPSSMRAKGFVGRSGSSAGRNLPLLRTLS